MGARSGCVVDEDEDEDEDSLGAESGDVVV